MHTSAHKQSANPNDIKCKRCTNVFDLTLLNCPHCGDGTYYPNVNMAKRDIETSKLDERYASALELCSRNGIENIGVNFMDACSKSDAVVACKIDRVFELATKNWLAYATYQDAEARKIRSQVPSDFDWDILRPNAEMELIRTKEFSGKIIYACLSLDGRGLSSYGNCFLAFDSQMIDNRASCFEGNSAILFKQNGNFDVTLRSTWEDRGKLCFAVYATSLSNSTTINEFGEIIIKNEEEELSADFIEVHIMGNVSINSFTSIAVNTNDISDLERIQLDHIQSNCTCKYTEHNDRK